MRIEATTRRLRRRQLDKTMLSLKGILNDLGTPRGGWIRAIREALGMTTAQLAERMGISQPAVSHLEKAEMSGGISLNTLGKAAAALDCRLVYVLVPKMTLEDTLKSQARRAARTLIERVAHTMALEAQATGSDEYERQIDELAEELVRTMRSEIWRAGSLEA